VGDSRGQRVRASPLCAASRLTRSWRNPLLVSICLLLLVFVCLSNPSPAKADTQVSLALSGWGWCLAYRDVANVAMDLNGTMIPRADAPEIADLYLTGTLTFNLSSRTDTFDLELRGTKVRSLFFLRQVSGGAEPLMAEFEGTWLSTDNYVACEGRLAIPAPNHVAKPYIFVLRTTDTSVSTAEPGGWVGDWDFIVQKSTLAFDEIADRITQSGEEVKQLLGDVLTQVAVIFREVRKLGTPYFL
jgi:hypothetical protein